MLDMILAHEDHYKLCTSLLFGCLVLLLLNAFGYLISLHMLIFIPFLHKGISYVTPIKPFITLHDNDLISHTLKHFLELIDLYLHRTLPLSLSTHKRC